MSASELTTLVDWLDRDAPRAPDGAAYVSMHARLIAYFARKGCRAPEELADATMERVSRRLREAGSITGVAPAQFCYITARYVFLEDLRRPDRQVALLREPAAPPTDDTAGREGIMRCLDDCLGRLDAQNRELILEYYGGSTEDRIAVRRRLASRLGVTANALAIRASRLRDSLRDCLGRCAPPR